MMTCDYLIVGAGLYGSVFAHEASKRGKKCIVIDKRDHIGGNVYTKAVSGINVHWYGPHIFHTSNEKVWKYISQFAKFNNFINSPIAIYRNEVYNLPFNMNTFSRMWGVLTPSEARKELERRTCGFRKDEPGNLEEKVLSLVGKDIYEKLIKGYTEKQWGRACSELPAFIIDRLPLRFTYDNNYYNDRYQGIPEGGYAKIIERLLEGVEVKLGINYRDIKTEASQNAKKIVYSGMIDEFFDYCLGKLEYRSLTFEHEVIECDNYQGNAVVNYTEREVPYTRVIEHKHFEFGSQPCTVITREYPAKYVSGIEPYYPVNDQKNMALYQRYRELASIRANVLFGGRLGEYRYYDMDKVIESALSAAETEFGKGQ
jgi:UDP-galactopyranose mutase